MKAKTNRILETCPVNYRPCAGIALFHPDGRVFIGKRADTKSPVGAGQLWQMPQGGIDEGEDPQAAALRELYEETNVRSVSYLAEIEKWLTYDFPESVAGKRWKGKYVGQAQRWFAYLFTGDESEIDILSPGGGEHKPEFAEWRWDTLSQIPDLIVPFKRGVYEDIVREFADIPASL